MKRAHIISIFPESFDSYFSTSIVGNAISKGLFEIDYYKLNDFSDKNYKHVDDKAYGMHGQVISAEPLGKAIEYIFSNIGKKVPVIYMSARGELLNQEKVENYYETLEEDFIIICGHYEGIDERIIELYVDHEISIGEYVLTSGELASMVFLDALVRHIPDVLGNIESLKNDSFSERFDRQKEYPVYTRPREYKGKIVPDVLVSGNHNEIEKWKKNNYS